MGNKSITPCNSLLSSPGRYNLSLSTVQYKCKVKWTAYSLETPFSKKNNNKKPTKTCLVRHIAITHISSVY